MSNAWSRVLGVGLTAALAVITLVLTVNGQLALYINPDGAWFAVAMAIIALVGCVFSFAIPLGGEDDHGHDHDHGHHHHHDDAIKAFVFQSNRPFDPAKLEEYMGALTQVYGQDMLRYKGVLFMNGTNRRMIFQGVHMLMGADVGRPWGKDERPATKIVFIGRNLPKDAILKGLEACLAR